MIYKEMVKQISEIFVSEYPQLGKANIYKEFKNTVLNIIDAVLSLQWNYNKQVIPVKEYFQKKYPKISEIKQVLSLYENARVGENEINFLSVANNIFNNNAKHKARITYNVLTTIYQKIESIEGKNDYEKVKIWAENTVPEDAFLYNIPYFKVAGFQYLRMLFGVKTVKPDSRIFNFLSDSLGVEFKSGMEFIAIHLFEDAAKEANKDVTGLDYAIWEKFSNNNS